MCQLGCRLATIDVSVGFDVAIVSCVILYGDRFLPVFINTINAFINKLYLEPQYGLSNKMQ